MELGELGGGLYRRGDAVPRLPEKAMMAGAITAPARWLRGVARRGKPLGESTVQGASWLASGGARRLGRHRPQQATAAAIYGDR